MSPSFTIVELAAIETFKSTAPTATLTEPVLFETSPSGWSTAVTTAEFGIVATVFGVAEKFRVTV